MRYLLSAASLLFLVGSCDGNGSSVALPIAPLQPWTNTASVRIEGALGELKVECILAVTPKERAKGLMYRKQPLGETKGMLFIMDSVDEHSFWMKNTYIPLDMIFITEDETVACIVKNAQPLTQTSRKCSRPSRYVLEVDAGLSERYGIVSGQNVHVTLP